MFYVPFTPQKFFSKIFFFALLWPIVLKNRRFKVRNFDWIGTACALTSVKEKTSNKEPSTYPLFLHMGQPKVPLPVVSACIPSERCSVSISLPEKQGTDQDAKEVSLVISKAKRDYFCWFTLLLKRDIFSFRLNPRRCLSCWGRQFRQLTSHAANQQRWRNDESWSVYGNDWHSRPWTGAKWNQLYKASGKWQLWWSI